MNDLFTNNFPWSSEQDDIFEYELNEEGQHLLVRARAGCAKTTTIVEAGRRWVEANPNKAIVVGAFNTTIAKELVRKFAGTSVLVKTLHALGFAACREYRDSLIIEDLKKVDISRKDALTARVCKQEAPDQIRRLVSKLHTLAREVAPHATTYGDLTALALAHDCQPDPQWEFTEYNSRYVEEKALEAMVLAADVKSGDVIDFSDMIFLPCRNHWLLQQWDKVIIDEAQDMTLAQLEIGVGSLKDGGRVSVVGDDRQAIYGFRGADVHALDRLKTELYATELGLKQTFRCGHAIVREANKIVPDLRAAEGNPEGDVYDLGVADLYNRAGPGNFILSRTNAPIVDVAMTCIRAGKRARVAGKDLGQGLTTLIRKLKAPTVPALRSAIEYWVTRETERHRNAMAKAEGERRKAFEAKIDAVRDKAEMLVSITEGAHSVNDVCARVDALFADDGLGMKNTITCSSIHKAKGLEADRVFVLADTLRNHSREELNIQYVAVTRARHELAFVVDPDQQLVKQPWKDETK